MKYYLLILFFLYITFNTKAQGGSANKSSPNYTGTYNLITKTPSVSGTVEIKRIGPDSIKFYLSVVHYGDIAETYGTFEISDRHGIFYNTLAGAKNCPISFFFHADTLYIKQGGNNSVCSFGLNAHITGHYKKIDSPKPAFQVLKRREYERKHPEEHKKRMKMIANAAALFSEKLRNHPVKIDSFFSELKYSTSDSLDKSMAYYNNFLKKTFRNNRYIRGAANVVYKKEAKQYLNIKKKLLSGKPWIKDFPKKWIGIVKTSEGYAIPSWGDHPVTLEIFGNVIIHNILGCIGTGWTKGFIKTGMNTYRINPPFESNEDSLNIFNIKVSDTIHRIISLSTRFMNCNFIAKNYRFLMVPADSIMNYPILIHPPQLNENETSVGILPNRGKNPVASRDKIIKLVMYKSKLKQSFLDSTRQAKNKKQLGAEAFLLSKWEVLYTMRILKNNKNFQAFHKKWICVHKKGSEYVLCWNGFNPNIQIKDNRIIINTRKRTCAHFIKSFHKTSSGTYKLLTFFPGNDSLNVFTFKNIDLKTGMIEADFNLITTNGFQSYSWKMVPIKNMLKFLFEN